MGSSRRRQHRRRRTLYALMDDGARGGESRLLVLPNLPPVSFTLPPRKASFCFFPELTSRRVELSLLVVEKGIFTV